MTWLLMTVSVFFSSYFFMWRLQLTFSVVFFWFCRATLYINDKYFPIIINACLSSKMIMMMMMIMITIIMHFIYIALLLKDTSHNHNIKGLKNKLKKNQHCWFKINILKTLIHYQTIFEKKFKPRIFILTILMR